MKNRTTAAGRMGRYELAIAAALFGVGAVLWLSAPLESWQILREGLAALSNGRP